MQLHYSYRSEDMISIAHSMNVISRFRRIFERIFLGSIALFILCLGLFRLFKTGWTWSVGLDLFISVFITVVALYRSRPVSPEILQTFFQPIIEKKQTIVLEEEGIQLKSADDSIRYSWKSMKDRIKTSQFLVLHLNSNTDLFIPLRAFQNPSDLIKFEEQLDRFQNPLH